MEKQRIFAVNDIWHVDVWFDDHDIMVKDSAHDDNSITLTRGEWKKVVRKLTEILNDGTAPCTKPHNQVGVLRVYKLKKGV